MRGVRVFTAFGDSGYGIAGTAYVRALVNSGIPVHWSMFDWSNGSMAPPELISITDALARVSAQTLDAKTNDSAALLRATERPIVCDVALLHTVPEHTPFLRQAHMRNVIYTTWETTRVPTHWLPLLDAVDAIAVPSMVNRDAFRGSGVRQPVEVVPHIRRSFWHEFSVKERNALFATLGLRTDALTLLSINTNQTRKNLRQLVQSFCRAFDADARVQLLIKTSRNGELDEFPFASEPSEALLKQWVDAESTALGRPPPPIRWICNDRLNPRQIDALYSLADACVSFSHGEGWGLCTFDAASMGIPVVMPAWGGHRDYLPDPWDGMVPCALSATRPWPMSRPSVWPDQRWATMQDGDCIAALRNIPARIDAMRANARRHQAQIANEFSEARVARMLISVLQGQS
jgi:glycosyltransferase involved in cell wall biosynthesis